VNKLKALAATATLAVLVAIGTNGARANDIFSIAASSDSFETLAAALETAGLVDTLQQDGPFTVFAPTDEAFTALPEGTVENLLKPKNRDMLVAILAHHVVRGAVISADLVGKDVKAVTVNGAAVAIDGNIGSLRQNSWKMSQDGKGQIGGYWNPHVQVNDAPVVHPDIVASNGVIHLIDKVLLP